jgi:hypothetical protein
MTDDEADAWFHEHGDFAVAHSSIGMTGYQLWKKGRKQPNDHTVGFVVPASMAQPTEEDARRFLIRWFLGSFGAYAAK